MSISRSSRHFSGKAASPGIGIGPALILEDRKQVVNPEKIQESDIELHIKKLETGIAALKSEFELLKKQANEKDVADIIEAQIQTLLDPELQRAIEQKIRMKRLNVVFAIYSTFNGYISLMANAGANWAEERTVDIESIRDQLIAITQQNRQQIPVKEGDVVFATEIPPTVMIELSRTKISGIVIQKGGLTSHAVILSQSLGIPCVVGLTWKQTGIENGMLTLLDGSDGTVIVNPSSDEEQEFQNRREENLRELKAEREIKQSPQKTGCGEPFSLRANVEFLEELPRITEKGAKGVGLLRTETILFQKREFNVDDQIEFYSEVMKASGSNRVTIRLFDAGGDKLLDDADEEANPFLGWRGIRMLLDKRDLLSNQIEAIFRTAALFPGRISLLVPMITGIEEIEQVKGVVDQVRSALKGQGVDPGDVAFGIMVEVPSTALMAGQLSAEVDFFSIGTNDLTQYTLATDRGNEKISGLFDPFHPAVWKLIRMTAEGAAVNGIPVSVCGEMASNPAAAACLFGMGIRDLSMTTNAIPRVKKLLCSNTSADMKSLAEKVLKADRVSEVHEHLESFSQSV